MQEKTVTGIQMTRVEKERFRLAHERIMVRVARQYEVKIRRTLYRMWKEAVKEFRKGNPWEGSVRMFESIDANSIENILESLYVSSYDSVSGIVKRHLESRKGVRVREKKGLLIANAVMFAKKYSLKKAQKITATSVYQISEEIIEGIQLGLSTADICDKMLKKGLVHSAHRAHMISRTEVHSAQMSASLDMADESQVVDKKEWVYVNDERVRGRGDNDDFDHTMVRAVELHSMFDVSGEKLMFPGDPDGSAGNIINCRCAMAYL